MRCEECLRTIPKREMQLNDKFQLTVFCLKCGKRENFTDICVVKSFEIRNGVSIIK